MNTGRPPAAPLHPTWMPAVLRRFPWVMAASLMGTWAGIASIHAHAGQPALGLSHAQATHLLMTVYLGIGLLFSLAMIGERLRGAWNRQLLQAAGVLILLGYFFSLRGEPGSESWLRFGMFFLAVHLLVSFAPFLRDNRSRAFWQYNQALFVRIITSLIFSGFLYLGLALALGALRSLLGLDIPKAAYTDLVYLIAGVFNTWFFLAGVPGDFDSLERQDSYPPLLKILSQYVFIPLVSLNVLILYVYMIKILVYMIPTLAETVLSGEWPVWLETRNGYPFLAAGLCGILSLLLLHPVRGGKEAPWVKFFARWFYPAQGPLLIFLFLILGEDIFWIGFKVKTYLELVMAFWIAGMAAYFTLGKGKSIKAIPVTLFLLCMLCSFGPWGVIGLPRIDQVRRLEKLMADNGLFRDGRFVPAMPEQIPTDQQQILDILRYLKEYGGLEVLRDRLPPGPKSAEVLADNWRLAEFLGLYHDYTHPSPPPPQPHPVACSRYEFFGSNYFSSGAIVDVKGYSFLLNRIEIGGCGAGTGFIESGSFRGPRKTDKIMFRCRDNTAIITLKGQTLSIPLEKVMIGLEESPSGKDNCGNSTPIDSALLVQGSNGQIKVALQLLQFGWGKGASHQLQFGLKKGSSPRLLERLEFDLLFEYKETGRPGKRSP